MRVPAVHITEEAVFQVFSKILLEYNIGKNDRKKLALAFLEQAKPYAITHRSLEINSQYLEKKTEKIKVSNTNDTVVFSKMVVIIRKKLKHVGVKPIKEGDRDWGLVKELSELANEFSKEFNLERT